MKPTIKLTPLAVKPQPLDVYTVMVTYMRGDGDMYDTVSVPCESEADFIETMRNASAMPTPSSEGGDDDVYNAWCNDTFGDMTIPQDIVYTDLRCTVTDYTGYYRDANGVNHKAELV